jgi:hypothetical protein
VQVLLDKGAHLLCTGYTPLHRAVRELCKLGQLHSSRQGWGRRAGPSTLSCQLEVVQLLLGKGADIHARTRDGKTPEGLALALGQNEVLNPQLSTLNPQL